MTWILLVMAAMAFGRRHERVDTKPTPADVKLVLLLLVIELRSGLSVLAALGQVASSLPQDENLNRIHRVARVAGLTSALEVADNRLRPTVSQLARSQATGSSLTGVVRRLIETELQTAKASRIAKARALPVRLMIPVTLLMLPGLVLMLYAPSLLAVFEDLIGGFR